MRHDKTPLLAVAAALLMLQLAACGTKGPQTGNTSLPAGSESTPGKTEEGAVDPEKARAADQAQDAAASPADGKAADPAAGNTADAAATAASPEEPPPRPKRRQRHRKRPPESCRRGRRSGTRMCAIPRT